MRISKASPKKVRVKKTILPVLERHRCDECKEVVILERMWWAETKPLEGLVRTKRYVCKKCAPSRKKAEELLEKYNRPIKLEEAKCRCEYSGNRCDSTRQYVAVLNGNNTPEDCVVYKVIKEYEDRERVEEKEWEKES